jgi:hypothetical protein
MNNETEKQTPVGRDDLFSVFGGRVNDLLCRRGATGISAQEIEDLAREVMDSTLLTMKVIAVRDLQKRGVTLERKPKQVWSCTVTLDALGAFHKPATLDVDHNDLDRPPECGDVLLIHRPRVMGYSIPENAEVRHGAKNADLD